MAKWGPTPHSATHVTSGSDKIRDASATQDGIVSTGAQTFAGAKTFKDTVTVDRAGDSAAVDLKAGNAAVEARLNQYHTSGVEHLDIDAAVDAATAATDSRVIRLGRFHNTSGVVKVELWPADNGAGGSPSAYFDLKTGNVYMVAPAGAGITAGVTLDATADTGGNGKAYNLSSVGVNGYLYLTEVGGDNLLIVKPAATDHHQFEFNAEVGFNTDGTHDGRPWFTYHLTAGSFGHNNASGIVLNGAGPTYPGYGKLDAGHTYSMTTMVPIPKGVQGDVEIEAWGCNLYDAAATTIKLQAQYKALAEGADFSSGLTAGAGTQVNIAAATAVTVIKKLYSKQITGLVTDGTHENLFIALSRVAPDSGTDLPADAWITSAVVRFRMDNLGY